MEFEDILEDIGGFGLYQKILFVVFMPPAFLVIPWFAMSLIFLTSTPDHWCYVPEISNSNLSISLQKQLIRPPSDTSCSMYDVNYSSVLDSGNWTVNPEWPTKPCEHGWVYDKVDYDATAVTRWNMVCEDSYYNSLVYSLLFIGNSIGTLVYGYMSDRIGRKNTFFIMTVIYAVTEISSVFSPNFVLFLILITVNGSIIVTIYSVAYIILLELVSTNIRTKVNMLTSTIWTFGLCLLPVIAWLTRNWIYLSAVTTGSAVGLLLYWKLLPESPSWLISEERYDEAVAILTRISKINGKHIQEGNLLRDKIMKLNESLKKRNINEEHGLFDFFKYPVLRKRFFYLIVCWIGTFIPYFGLQVNVRNLAGSEFINFFLVSLMEIPAHIITMFFMDRVGRRWCSVLFFAVTSVSCIIPAIYPQEHEIVNTVTSLCAKFGSSCVFMSVLQQTPELFPTHFRGVGMGLTRTFGLASTLLVPYIVYLDKYGSSIPYLVFSAITFVAAVCASFLPETLNKKLPQTVEDAEEIDRDFKFFSFSSRSSPKLYAKKTRSWTPSTLSAAYLSPSLKNSVTGERTERLPVVLIRNSALSK